jgi:hypothetical protein
VITTVNQSFVTVRRSGPGLKGVAKQTAYATMKALRSTQEEIQVAQREDIHRSMIIRKPPFIDRMVKITGADRPTKTNLVARVRIEGPLNNPRFGLMLTRHEEGGPHTANPRYFYIPTDNLRYPKSALVPRSMYPKALRLEDRRAIEGGTLARQTRLTRTGKIAIQGKRRTFILKDNTGREIGIYQRGEGLKGPTKPGDIQLIWSYKRRITLKPTLHFAKVARLIYSTRFAGHFDREFRAAMLTARP